MRRKKIITFAGTRPELIRLSCLLKKLDQYFDHTFVYTGQNYTDELSKIFFEDLKIRQPDISLNFPFSSPGEFIGKLYIEAEKIVSTIRPDASVILGDTNSCMVALLLERLGVKVFHLEAGNRCFNSETPEEYNRQLIDKASSINLVYTEFARRNLLAEGFANESVYKIGSPMWEVLHHWQQKINNSGILTRLGIIKGKYIPVSLHRQENINHPERSSQLITALADIAENMKIPVLLSCHPRFKDVLEKKSPPKSIAICDPFNFSDWCHLQKNSMLTISDSGSISEESAILGFKAITPRASIERQEAIESGSIMRVNPDHSEIMTALQILSESNISVRNNAPEDYLIQNTSDRVISVILNFI